MLFSLYISLPFTSHLPLHRTSLYIPGPFTSQIHLHLRSIYNKMAPQTNDNPQTSGRVQTEGLLLWALESVEEVRAIVGYNNMDKEVYTYIFL